MNRARLRWLLPCLSALPCVSTLGCGSEPAISLDPEGGPSSGYYRVSIELAEAELEPAAIDSVTLGGIRAYDLAPEPSGRLTVSVQGAPASGPADLELTSRGDVHSFPSAFQYDPPQAGPFQTVCAMGASLSQGVQNGVPTHHGSLVSPPAQVARQLGGYFPLPVLIHDFMPELAPSDIGPPPACAVPDIPAFVAASAIKVLKKLNGDFSQARIDPDLTAHNVAVGGSRLRDVLRGPAEDNFAGNLLSHLVFDPYGTSAVETSQLEVCESVQPTLILISDLYYNDIATALLTDDVVDVSLITPFDELEADLLELLDRVEATGAEVVFTNMPRPSILPAAFERKARMIEAARATAEAEGSDPDAAAEAAAAAADEAILATDMAATAINEALESAAAERSRIHVVDAKAGIEEASINGVAVGGTVLTTQKFGGLLGLDGVHFTDTGYALFGNLFISAINDRLGTSVPLIDLERVFAQDAGTPAKVSAAGLDASLCDR